MNTTRHAVLAGTLLFLSGCSSSQSKDISTEGMNSMNTVIADGSGSTGVTTVLRVGGVTSDDFVKLSAGDTLTASAGAVSQAMTPGTLLDTDAYMASLAADTDGTVVTIAFNRAAPQVSAPNTTVTLPDAFVVTSQLGTTNSYSRASDSIVITWTGSGKPDPMAYSATGTCVANAGAAIPTDTGSYTILAGTLQATTGNAGATCPVTLVLSRTRAGTVDPAFGGGQVSATQVRKILISSTP